MAGVKISNLPPATTPLAGNELAPIVRAGVTEHVTVAEISNAVFAVFTPASGLAATTVQDAIEELVALINTEASAANSSFTPYEWVTAINVQNAIQEIVDDLAAAGGATKIGFTPYGTIASTNVQTAIQELLDESVHKTSSTGSALMPIGTTAQRDVSPTNGALRYNSETAAWEYYDTIGWFPLNPTPIATGTTFTPYGTIAATNVQLAIQELRDESVYKTGLNGSAELPAGNSAQRDVTPTQGAIRYNSELSVWEGWNGSAWASFGISGGTIGPASDVTFTPYGSISATNVQTALQELDDETVKKTSSTGSALLPAGTTAQRDGSPTTGATRWNSSLSIWEGWNGSAWAVFGTTGKQVTSICIACSDETTALTTGTAKVTFRMPYAMTLTAVRASLTTAQASGSIFTVDINEGGTTILSTKLTIDNTELTSTSAATPAVISDTALADDASITVDIDQIGASGAAGLKIYLIGTI